MKRNGDTGDKRTWHIGGKQVNRDQDAERYKGFGRTKVRDVQSEEESQSSSSEVAPTQEINLIDTGAESLSGAPNDIMAGLAGLDLSEPTASGQIASMNAESRLVSEPSSTAYSAALPTKLLSTTARKTVLTHGADKWLNRLAYNSEGILFEDDQIQVGIKSEFHGHLGRIAIFFGNKISVSLESFTATIDVEDTAALAVTSKIPTSTLAGMSQIQQLVHVECKNVFGAEPVLNISYLAGSLQTLALRLPVYLIKFLEPVQLGSSDFFERWKQIGGPPREAQKIFAIVLDGGQVDVARNRKVVAGTGFGVLDGIDPNPNNIVAAGVLHMSTGGKVGCLLRLEPNTEARVSSVLYISSCEHRANYLTILFSCVG
jgi:AP-2 complex subunit alpha